MNLPSPFIYTSTVIRALYEASECDKKLTNIVPTIEQSGIYP